MVSQCKSTVKIKGERKKKGGDGGITLRQIRNHRTY